MASLVTTKVESFSQRRRSFGIGGAGNIRRSPSSLTCVCNCVVSKLMQGLSSDGAGNVTETTYVETTEDGQYRRGSVWSLSPTSSMSTGSRLMYGVRSLFGSNSTPKERLDDQEPCLP
jgi:hypothetical protein